MILSALFSSGSIEAFLLLGAIFVVIPALFLSFVIHLFVSHGKFYEERINSFWKKLLYFILLPFISGLIVVLFYSVIDW